MLYGKANIFASEIAPNLAEVKYWADLRYELTRDVYTKEQVDNIINSVEQDHWIDV